MLNITRTATCSRQIEEGGPIDRERTSRRGIFCHRGWSDTTEITCGRTDTCAIGSRGRGSRSRGAGSAGGVGFGLVFCLLVLLVLVLTLFGGGSGVRCCRRRSRRRC